MHIRMFALRKMNPNLIRRVFNNGRQCTVFELDADDITIQNDSSDVKTEVAFSTNRGISVPVESYSEHNMKRNQQTTLKEMNNFKIFAESRQDNA